MSHGYVVAYLRKGEREIESIVFANISFYALILAAIAFGLFGYSVVNKSLRLDAATIAEKARSEMTTISGDKNSIWKLKLLKYDNREKKYDMTVIKDKSEEVFNLVFDENGDIVKAEKN